MVPGVMERMMRGILLFRLVIEDVQGTWKPGQNKTPAQQAGAAQGIRLAGIGLESGQIADAMAEQAALRQPPA